MLWLIQRLALEMTKHDGLGFILALSFGNAYGVSRLKHQLASEAPPWPKAGLVLPS